MGKVVEFRSRFKGEAHVTSCLAAVAGSLAARSEYSIAILQLPGSGNDLKDLFDDHISDAYRDEIYRKTGLSALALMLKGGRPNEDKVRGCALKTLCPRLDIFHGSVEMAGEERADLLIPELAKAYDYVLVDTGDEKTECDISVCLLPQSRRAWKKFFEKEDRERKVFALNGYLKNSSCTARLFKLLYGKKLLTLRICPGFMDALSEGKVVEFFRTVANIGRFLPDHGFTEDVWLLCEEIVKGGRSESGNN